LQQQPSCSDRGRLVPLSGSNSRPRRSPAASGRGPELSGGDLVPVRESAEDLFSADPVFGEVDLWGRHGARRHSPALSKAISPISAGSRDCPLILWPCVGQSVGPPVIFRGLAGYPPRTVGHRNPGASGSVNRWLRPDSVRHMSVTTAMQGLTAAHHDTQRDNSKAAREPGYAQATGRFRRWWQVLGSNQRRLSRRFYSPPIPTHRNTH
jgi:hypothetical protein